MTDARIEHDVLRVSSTSPPQAVAAAISKCISEDNYFPTLRAIGHGAIGQANKAVAIAGGYTAARGVHLAVIIGFDTIMSDEGKEISAITLRIIPR